MTFSFSIESFLEKKSKNWDLKKIMQASEELSSFYRLNEKKIFLDKGHRIAYLSCRFPATSASIQHVLRQIKNRIPGFAIHSLLDVGAGPGTATIALQELLGPLERATLMEKDPEFLMWSKEILQQVFTKETSYDFQNVDLEKSFFPAPHDMVLFSYSIGEMSPEVQDRILKKSWDVCKKFLVIIEPGTKAGFARIKKFRQTLLEEGAHIVLPCPASGECPMKGENWCHFSERLPRSSLHRKVKNAELSYEDEKFSYLVFSKERLSLPACRVLRHPQKKSGHVILNVCSQGQVKDLIISKKDENYKESKKIEWGDELI